MRCGPLLTACGPCLTGEWQQHCIVGFIRPMLNEGNDTVNMKTGKNGEASPGRLPIFSKSRRVLPPEPRTGIRTPSLMADQKPLISDSPTNSVTTTGGAATSCLLVVDQYGRPVLLVSRLKADGSR